MTLLTKSVILKANTRHSWLPSYFSASYHYCCSHGCLSLRDLQCIVCVFLWGEGPVPRSAVGIQFHGVAWWLQRRWNCLGLKNEQSLICVLLSVSFRDLQTFSGKGWTVNALDFMDHRLGLQVTYICTREHGPVPSGDYKSRWQAMAVTCCPWSRLKKAMEKVTVKLSKRLTTAVWWGTQKFEESCSGIQLQTSYLIRQTGYSCCPQTGDV